MYRVDSATMLWGSIHSSIHSYYAEVQCVNKVDFIVGHGGKGQLVA